MNASKYIFRQQAGRVIMYLLLFAFMLWTIVPVYIVISNSFRPTIEIKQMPPKLVFRPILAHYERILTLDRFGVYFRNSVIISVSAAFLAILFGSMAGYGLKLFRSRIGKNISNLLLLGKMVPSITILMPLFIMMNRIHLTGTFLAPVLTLSCLSLPFVTWLMAGFIADIPVELIESAGIAGCSRVKTFVLIILPLLKPAIASAVILVMQSSWNELIFSLQLTNLNTYPLTVGIARYVGAVSVDWGKCSAAAALTMTPIIIIGFFMQKYLVSGMTSGAVKG
ncbi:MAG: carbohydrate ABC transporter permease [Treponema sp.]|jgi:multiple sugar transport system permease protein|nr:carbohydrate ABC transporter permease [Treponema sp.]